MIKGNKIYLRAIERKDIIILYMLSNEENVKRYNTIPNDIQSNDNGVNLRKALSILNENGTLIGFITYKESGYYRGAYSIGITIGSSYWGYKYGEDAMKTLIIYLFRELNAVRIELEVIRNNLRAINCYKKCEFIEEGIKRNKVYINGEYLETIIMGILREEMLYI